MFSFGSALVNFKAGRKLARKGWNGKDQYVMLMCGGGVGIAHDRPADETNELVSPIEPFFILIQATGRVNIWMPSVADILAVDWYVVKG